MSAVIEAAPQSSAVRTGGKERSRLNPKYLPLAATISLFVLVATLGSVFYDGFFSFWWMLLMWLADSSEREQVSDDDRLCS